MALTVRCFVDDCTHNQNHVCTARCVVINTDGACNKCCVVGKSTEDSLETLAEYKVRRLREEGLL